MDVYMMGVVYCPMNGEDQDSDRCLSCRHFAGHKINGASADKRSRKARLYVACRYTGKAKKIYQSTKSKRLATVITEEPLPPTPAGNEIWERLS